jgi:hypothetical protein
MTRSPLQRRGVILGTLNEDNYSGPSISPLLVAKRRFKGDEYTSYTALETASTEIFSSIQMRFRLFSKSWKGAKRGEYAVVCVGV